jgi:hypothetical protein
MAQTVGKGVKQDQGRRQVPGQPTNKDTIFKL